MRELLRRASLELERAAEAPDEPACDLQIARYAVHRALVALEPCEPESQVWPPPRLVALTIDEAVSAAGVIGLLCEGHDDPALDLLAKRTVAMLSERLSWAADGAFAEPRIDLDAEAGQSGF